MPTDIQFTQDADRYLNTLMVRLSGFDPDELDPDLAMGVLSITFADGTKCILNRQTAAQQLWLAQGASAWHFARDANGEWLDTKRRGRHTEILADALSRKIGRKVAL